MTQPWSLRHLRVFSVVAREGSFTRAAEQLEMSQPAVSKTVRELELAMQMPLFSPTDRRQLTEAGQVVLHQAQLIQAQMKAASDAMRGLQSAQCRRNKDAKDMLHVGAVSPAHYFLPRMLQAFRLHYPLISLKLTVARRGELLEMLTNRRIDIAITGYPPSDAESEAVQFARHPHVMVARQDHALAQQSHLDWQALKAVDLIVREKGSATRMFFEQLLQANQLQNTERIEMSSNEAVKQAVICGLGISFLSAHVCQTEIQSGLLVALNLPDMPKYIDWCVIHPRNAQPIGLPLAFKQFVLKEGERHSECIFSACQAPSGQ